MKEPSSGTVGLRKMMRYRKCKLVLLNSTLFSALRRHVNGLSPLGRDFSDHVFQQLETVATKCNEKTGTGGARMTS